MGLTRNIFDPERDFAEAISTQLILAEVPETGFPTVAEVLSYRQAFEHG
jgi:hypothetical protein